MTDEAALERYAEAAWKHRCDRMAEAEERPPETGTWAERAPFLREIDKSTCSLVAAMAVHDADLEAMDLRAEVFRYRMLLPVILHALKFTLMHGEAKVDCKAALKALGAKDEGPAEVPHPVTPGRPWPYDGPEGRARLTGSLADDPAETAGYEDGDDDDK